MWRAAISREGRSPARKGVHVETGQVRLASGRDHAGQVPSDRLVERDAERATEGIEQRAIDERRSEAGGQAVEPARRPAIDLRPIDREPVPEGGVVAARDVRLAREAERQAELIEVLLVAERRVLVEPLGREHLGGRALGLAAVLEPDARAQERLGRRRERHHAEAKRHAEAHVALDGDEVDRTRKRGAGISPSPGRPWT